MLLLALAACEREPFSAPTGDPGARLNTPAGSIAHTLDARLIVTPVLSDTAAGLVYTRLSDTLARPRWRYPAIGAVIGLAAGIVHAHAITRGDYVGFPVEPMYLFPPAYAAAGAFLGVLVDSADRERKARRD